MIHRPLVHVGLVAAFALPAALPAQNLSIDGQTSVVKQLGSTVNFTVTAPPGHDVTLYVDTEPGPSTMFNQQVPIGQSSNLGSIPLGIVPDSGVISNDYPIGHDESTHGSKLYYVALVLDPQWNVTFTNGADATTVARPQLAGNPLAEYPYFEHVAAFNRGEPIRLGIDPRYTALAGETVDIYVVAAKTAAQWLASPTLVDVRGAPQTVTFTSQPSGIEANVVDLIGTIPGPDETPGSGDTRIGVGYDLVIDRQQDGSFDNDHDLIDGFDEDEAGFYVVRDTANGGKPANPANGPLAVSELDYLAVGNDNQIVYYPTNIGQLGELPLVVIQHGGPPAPGFVPYTAYGHIGYHLASYGYVVMSIDALSSGTSSDTILQNIDHFLCNLDTIANGVMLNHVDEDSIALIGHSDGGRYGLQAYDHLRRQLWLVNPSLYVPVVTHPQIKLISCIAPNANNEVGLPDQPGLDPHDVTLHLLITPADHEMPGCDESAPHLIHERGTGCRYITSVHGAGHHDFLHDPPPPHVAYGDPLIGWKNTNAIMLGYMLPLLEHNLRGDVPSGDFLWRQYESFHAIGSPDVISATNLTEITVNLTVTEPFGMAVIDDFQTSSSSPAASFASSGATVTSTVSHLREGLMRDEDVTFDHSSADPFNGFTYTGAPGTVMDNGSRGCVFSYSGASSKLSYDLTTATTAIDFHDYAFLSFRAAQGTRHPSTTAEQGDQVFAVRLVDADGDDSTIRISAYGGGVEEPFQRGGGPATSGTSSGCSTVGLGWWSEFETIRIRLADFKNDASDLDLETIETIEFLFGFEHGNGRGRIGIDDIVLVK